MKKSLLIVLMSIFLNSHLFAFDDALDQQAMVFIQIPLNADNSAEKKQFGLRVDRGYVGYGETIQLSKQQYQPAVVNVAFNDYGLRRFELNGFDYAAAHINKKKTYGVYNAAEGEDDGHDVLETLEDIPLGVLGGLAILMAAIAL